MLEQLSVAIAVALRRLDLPRGLERQPQLLVVGAEAIGRPARDHDVVALAVGQGAERGLELAGAAVQEAPLLPPAVAEEALLLLPGAADPDLDVVVVHQRAAPEHRIAARRHLP